MCPTTTVARRELPYPTDRQFIALQALLDAYYAFNAVDLDNLPGCRQWAIERDRSPMDLTRLALVKGLKFLPGVSQVSARRIFNECISNGEGIQWNYDHWLVGAI